MKTKIYKTLSMAVIFLSLLVTACVKDLDTIPLDDDVLTSEKIYLDFDNYKLVLAKVYGGLILTGQKAPNGDQDILGLDEGASQYTRALFNVQEVVTDEAICGWGDADLVDYNKMDWSSDNTYIANMYYRIYYQVSMSNEFLRQTTDAKVSDKGFTAEEKEAIHEYRAEARFLRAFSWYHGLDLFANIPFVTEEDPVGAFLPEPITRPDLFNYIESELLDIEDQLPAPKANEYGRVDQATVWMLLAHMYLNAEVYGVAPKYAEVITYTKKVIAAGYEMADSYAEMFMADNHKSKGIIYALPFDGINSKTWGGTTFLVSAAIGGSMVPANFGTNQKWNGLRVRPEFVALFPSDNSDKRKMFYTSGQSLDIADYLDFTNGYAVTKWTNMTSTGVAGSDGTHADTDLPIYRLADAYLMYAEAVLRGGTGGDLTTALGYVNEIRDLAYGNTSGRISSGDLTLDFILDERGRELYWECFRRTDLIRFDKFSGGAYIWSWKGGTQAGKATDSRFDLYPIPDNDLGANPKLTPTQGY